jgi:hypothetical protein
MYMVGRTDLELKSAGQHTLDFPRLGCQAGRAVLLFIMGLTKGPSAPAPDSGNLATRNTPGDLYE